MKRTSYKAQLSNSESLGLNQTIVPALVRGNIEKKTAKGSPFYRIQCIAMVKDNLFVKVNKDKDGKVPTMKRVKYNDDDTQTEVDEEVKGTTITPNQSFLATCFDRVAGAIETGAFVKLAVTCDIYDGRYTFKCDKVIMDRNSDALSVNVYNKFVQGTELAVVPRQSNINPADFPDVSDPKYIARNFILPVSNDTTSFQDVQIELDDTDRARFYCKKRDETDHFIGVNHDIGGDKTANMLNVVYTPNNTDERKVMMKLAYMPEIWSVFGVQNLDAWADSAARLIFHAKEWFAYGYSQLDKIEAIRGNQEQDDDCDTEPLDYSTGFCVKFGINMSDTARAAGIPVSYNYIAQNYGPDSDYSNDVECTNHHLNAAWKVKVKQNKQFCINLTDLSDTQMASFVKEAASRDGIEYYAILPVGVDNDNVYLFDGTPDEVEANLIDSDITPSLVFAINK